MHENSETRVGRTWPRWLLEGLFVVVGVLLGFGAARFGEYRDDRALAARALVGLQQEVEHNRAVLEPLVSVHRVWLEALETPPARVAGEAAIDVWFATRPELPDGVSPFPFLRRSAWDAALSGNALRLIDYEVITALSEIYRLQEITGANIDRLAEGALSDASTFDPGARDASVRLLWLTLADIESAERMLLELYQRHLPTIAAPVGRVR